MGRSFKRGHILYNRRRTCFRNLRDNLPQRHTEDTEMPYYTAYADDVDFITNVMSQRIAPGCLSKWYLNISETVQRATEKETCGCGFPDAVVSLGQTPPSIPRPPAATVQCVYSPCARIQHGHVWTNADGMSIIYPLILSAIKAR